MGGRDANRGVIESEGVPDGVADELKELVEGPNERLVLGQLPSVPNGSHSLGQSFVAILDCC